MNTSTTAPNTHQPWCDVEDACAYPENSGGSHYGRRHVMAWEPTVAGRNPPELAELVVRPTLHQGRPIIDIEIDTATSGSEDVMWLTPGEARRYAGAILAAVSQIETAQTVSTSTRTRALG